jgi:hypothetical protein
MVMERIPNSIPAGGRSFLRAGGALLVLGLGIIGLPAGGADEAQPAQAKKNIDIAICLDVSNSMDGLIGSAKAKLWDIVNELARIKPTPNLRVALFSYGNDGYDPKAGWVKKDLDLTTDLDILNQKLFALSTRGGTEYVTRVCRDAVDQLDWSRDPNTLKVIFVCGNEPAGQDPVVKLAHAADKARKAGIVINPIFCGNPNHPDARDWKEFTALTGGRFASIDQDKGTVAIATPMDKKLAELSAKLATTYVCYGKKGGDKARNQLAQDQNAAVAGTGVAAERALSKANGIYRCEDWDLVDRLKSDPKFDIRKVPADELPEAMRKLTPDQRVAHVQKLTSERAALQKTILALSAQRTAFINEEMRRNPNAANRAFNTAIRATLREQAKSKGIPIPE